MHGNILSRRAPSRSSPPPSKKRKLDEDPSTKHSVEGQVSRPCSISISSYLYVNFAQPRAISRHWKAQKGRNRLLALTLRLKVF